MGMALVINRKKFEDKVRACWVGKNIGGTMGAPYEGRRDLLDIKGFVTKKGEILPNDDLDLQLVWLLALERHGVNEITAPLLGEYWLAGINPHWNEYGIGKANMKRGLIPPFSGDYENNWRDSNGAWIRTEIWACAMPGAVSRAVELAIEDAKVDHGAGEGTIAAAFVAALQSAAFIFDDIRECIDVALCAVPETSRVAQSVKIAVDCYDAGKSWQEARNTILETNADIGDGWFEAPSNVGYTVIGLLYGEGDFKKSMIIAINCGDDTDCTGATVGATLGILYGMKAIPADWAEHIGDEIVTWCISKTGDLGAFLPKNCTELTKRILDLAPVSLRAKRTHIHIGDEDKLIFDKGDVGTTLKSYVSYYLEQSADLQMNDLRPYSVQFDNVLIRATASLSKPNIEANDEVEVTLLIKQKTETENEVNNAIIRWLLPEGFTVTGGKTNISLRRFDGHNQGRSETVFTIKSGEKIAPENRLVCEIIMAGHHTPLYVSIPLLAK